MLIAWLVIAVAYSVRNPENMTDLDGIYSNCVDASSESTLGEFIETTSAFEAKFIEMPPQIKREYFPKDTEVATLVRRHRERIQGKSDLIVMNSLQDVMDSAMRSNQISHVFREELGGRIQTSEIENLQKNLDEKLERKKQADGA